MTTVKEATSKMGVKFRIVDDQTALMKMEQKHIFSVEYLKAYEGKFNAWLFVEGTITTSRETAENYLQRAMDYADKKLCAAQ